MTDAQTQAIQSIRDNVLVFGCDLSDATDEEIIEVSSEIRKAIESSGLNMHVAGRAFRRLAQCSQDLEDQS